MVIVLVEIAFAHPALPVAVNVKILLPAVISAALGVYVQVVKEVAFAKVPVPFDVQVTPTLLLALEPAVILTAPLLEQVAMAVPATAVAAAFTVIVTLDAEAVHGALLIVHTKT